MKLRELLEKATGGEWTWWTSCSWRRLYARVEDGRDTPVLMPTISPSDRHPDIIVSREDMALIVALHNCAEELLDVAEAAEKIAAEHREPIVKKLCGVTQPDRVCDCDLCVAIRKLKEKEGKL